MAPAETGDEASVAGDDSAEEEEEWPAWRDDPDLHEFGIHRQLPVDDEEPDFTSGPPDSAEEYLRRVRYEADRLPEIVVANVDPYMLRAEQTSMTPGYLLDESEGSAVNVDADWLQSFLMDFSSLRQRVASAGPPLEEDSVLLPAPLTASQEPAWRSHCLGKWNEGEAASASAPSTWHTPEVNMLMHLGQAQIARLLRWNIEWLREDAYELLEASTHWIFALATLLEKPISADSAAFLRIMLRHLRSLPCQTLGEASCTPVRARRVLLFAIAGAYFGQDESLAGHGLRDLY